MFTRTTKTVAAIILGLFILTSGSVLANYTGGPNASAYLAFAEKMPAPVGGLKAIYSHITSYPKVAEKAGIQGKVFVLAYVDEQGNCEKADIVRGIGGGCDEAAVEAVKATKFTPGSHKGVTSKVKLSLSIVFKLK
ncbi:MAG: energy transducer TonB [Melioribacteraceae bacterium]|nr:energy transducer TonB [Melioribacteraceae bacterium]